MASNPTEAAPSDPQASAFTLAVEGSTDHVGVTRFEGQERMNDVYTFDVRLTVRPGIAPLGRQAIQKRASLRMHVDGATARAVHGLVASAAIVGVDAFGSTLQELRIVPRLALLKKRRSSRIFQDVTAQEIVDHVLALSGVRRRWALQRKLQRRAYCVQYDETDYAFVTRLCASEGVFFFFEHDPQASLPGEGAPLEVVVFSDAPAGYPAIHGSTALHFRGDEGAGSALLHGAIPADEWQVICHHGAFYALTTDWRVRASQFEISTRLQGAFYDTKGNEIPADYWSLFYWRLRYMIIKDTSPGSSGSALMPRERTSFPRGWRLAAEL